MDQKFKVLPGAVHLCHIQAVGARWPPSLHVWNLSLSTWCLNLQHLFTRLRALTTVGSGWVLLLHAVWLPRDRKQKLLHWLTAVPRNGTASLLPCSAGQRRNRACPDPREWRNRLHPLMEEWQGNLAEECAEREIMLQPSLGDSNISFGICHP